MTDFTVPLIVLSLGGAALAAFGLYKRDMRDVLGAVGFFVLGLVLGAIVQVIFPGGVLLGGLGGVALGKSRLDEIRLSRRRVIEEELDSAGGLAERMVFLHERLDRIELDPKWTTKLLGTATVAILGLFSGVLLLTGLFGGGGSYLMVGGLAAGLPAAAWASRTIRAEEHDLLSKALTACEDEAAGVLP